MSKIISIGTAVPEHQHDQSRILEFMQRVYAASALEKRKLKFLYDRSGITSRYSCLSDFSKPAGEWTFFPASENLEPFPSLDERMAAYREHAAPLAMKAIRNCQNKKPGTDITHLLTVSCTGMSAPGLDLELMELLNLPVTTWRTSINFMGCYAAIHALKVADALCKADPSARVLIVCVELCTLHFQKEFTEDNITSSLLFGDGAAALLVTGDDHKEDGLNIDGFYSAVSLKGKPDMSWQMSTRGYLMTLSGYVPALIEEDFNGLVTDALKHAGLEQEDITHWCIHPGGKRILQAVHQSLGFTNGQLQPCFDVLNDFGNMSSPTVLFVLEKIEAALKHDGQQHIFGAAFGPGLTMETVIFSA